MWGGDDRARDLSAGLDALRQAVVLALSPSLPVPAPAGGILLAEAAATPGRSRHSARTHLRSVAGEGAHDQQPRQDDDHDLACSSEDAAADRERLIALVELARTGDKEAFGLLYDHYHQSVYRFLFYRTRSSTLAEDLTSETFFRALRSMNGFRWQGRDFGAWLMTIARNLTTDHFKAGRTRLELTTEDMSAHDDVAEGPDVAVIASLTNEILVEALQKLPDEQRDCLIMRFLQGLTIAETALALGRSDGAVKQLQLRGVRNLAKLMPEGVRD